MAIDTSIITGGGVIDFLKSSSGEYLFPITKIDSIYNNEGNTLQSILDNKQPKGDYSLASHNHDTVYAAKSHTHDYLDKKFTAITVNGNADTYYPVTFGLFKNYYTGYTFKLGRGYSDTAPDTWYTSTHKGGLTFQLNISGDGAWGGNSKHVILEHFNEMYCNMIAGVDLLKNNTLCIWLRGGGAVYYATTEYGAPSYEVHYSAFNDSDDTTSIAPISKSSLNTSWYKKFLYSYYFKPESATLSDAAVKLNTARTLTIGNTGKSFDGSGNVSWSLSEIGAAASSHTHSNYLPLSGGAMTGTLQLKYNSPALVLRPIEDPWGASLSYDTNSGECAAFVFLNTRTTFKIIHGLSPNNVSNGTLVNHSTPTLVVGQSSTVLNTPITIKGEVTAPSFTEDGSMTIVPGHSNEINFGGSTNSDAIYFGYRATSNKPIPTKFVFGNYTGDATLHFKAFYQDGQAASGAAIQSSTPGSTTVLWAY